MIDEIGALLREVKVIALVGASARPERPSHEVMAFLQHRGYRVIPVNPGLAGKILLGERVRASLRDIMEEVDMVDVFRRADAAEAIAQDAIAIGARALWLQLGVVNEEAAEKARAAGLRVVMDRCPKIELMRRDD
jgi:predicted CoA-binding protein